MTEHGVINASFYVEIKENPQNPKLLSPENGKYMDSSFGLIKKSIFEVVNRLTNILHRTTLHGVKNDVILYRN